MNGRTRLAGWLLAAAAAPVQAQVIDRLTLDANLERYANGILSLMAYTVTPDVTTSSLSISNASTGNPGLAMTQFGGGFTVSKDVPLFLEGNAAYARYDPVFVATEGEETRFLPAKWNALSATGGIGWDFRVAPTWVLRPIFNFSIGYVTSDLRLAKAIIEDRTGEDFDFLDSGRLKAYGLGGALMLDYEDYQPDREIDFEGRFSRMDLNSYGGTSEGVQGHAFAETLNLWARWRAPTGMVAFERPVRYVLELAHTQFLSGDVQVLGFEALTSFGVGMELDSSAYDLFVTRWRAVLRHVVGNNVNGWSLGLAVSF